MWGAALSPARVAAWTWLTTASCVQALVQRLQHAVASLGEENARLAARVLGQAQHAEDCHDSCASREAERAQRQVLRLRVERRLLKAVTRLALAITTDALTGTWGSVTAHGS